MSKKIEVREGKSLAWKRRRSKRVQALPVEKKKKERELTTKRRGKPHFYASERGEEKRAA